MHPTSDPAHESKTRTDPGADEETGMTFEERQAAHYLEMLRLIDEEERVTRTPAEQRILDLRAKMAVTENPLEKQRLEGEILLSSTVTNRSMRRKPSRARRPPPPPSLPRLNWCSRLVRKLCTASCGVLLP